MKWCVALNVHLFKEMYIDVTVLHRNKFLIK